MNRVVDLPYPLVRTASRNEQPHARIGSVRLMWSALAVSLLAIFTVAEAHAAVSLRVEARPIASPIQAFVTVTDADGRPVSGLTASDFNVLVDGVAVSSPTFSLPPTQDVGQRVSVVFTLDSSGSVTGAALTAMQEAVMAFIDNMQVGDYAAIVKFNASNPSKASVVQPFTRIDGGAGNSALVSALMAPYPDPGQGTNLYDAVVLSVQQFALPSTPLPNGPKAVILISDGKENASTVNLTTVLTTANSASVPVFTIGVGSISNGGTPLTIMTQLAIQTGGEYLAAPTGQQVTGAYVKISSLLNNEYLLSFTSPITDCNSHSIEVRVAGQASPATASFTRCTPTSVTPPPPPSGGGSGGGGGGGSTGVLEVIVGLSLLALRRRRRSA